MQASLIEIKKIHKKQVVSILRIMTACAVVIKIQIVGFVVEAAS
jgi:hypothetical protein